jgi:hypothetical protein
VPSTARAHSRLPGCPHARRRDGQGAGQDRHLRRGDGRAMPMARPGVRRIHRRPERQTPRVPARRECRGHRG